jgi:DTW domain-containing protein YfiP
VLEHGGRDAVVDVAPWVRPGVWLVYPRSGPGPGAPPPDGRPEALLFLDGSWAQTRHMLQRLPGVAALPRLTLAAAPARRRLRRPPDGGLATLEAIAGALGHLGEADAAARLDALYALAVARSFNDAPLVATRSSC